MVCRSMGASVIETVPALCETTLVVTGSDALAPEPVSVVTVPPPLGKVPEIWLVANGSVMSCCLSSTIVICSVAEVRPEPVGGDTRILTEPAVSTKRNSPLLLQVVSG